MKIILALILLTSLFTVSRSEAIEFTADSCKDLTAITKEVIELELAGARWQGGTSPCLQQSRFKTVYAVQEKVGDSYLLDPEYVLAKGREVKVISEKWLDIGAMEIKIAYIGKKNGKDVPVQDGFVYSLNYGKNREKRGCATVSEEPKHFVMRAECVKE
jgi:hypothetical protein